jgi:hypothetical protein
MGSPSMGAVPRRTQSTALPPKPLCSLIALSVLSFRTVMCVRCGCVRRWAWLIINQDQLLECADPLIANQKVATDLLFLHPETLLTPSPPTPAEGGRGPQRVCDEREEITVLACFTTQNY